MFSRSFVGVLAAALALSTFASNAQARPDVAEATEVGGVRREGPAAQEQRRYEACMRARGSVTFGIFGVDILKIKVSKLNRALRALYLALQRTCRNESTVAEAAPMAPVAVAPPANGNNGVAPPARTPDAVAPPARGPAAVAPPAKAQVSLVPVVSGTPPGAIKRPQTPSSTPAVDRP